MKKGILSFILLLGCLLLFFGCSPEDLKYVDNDIVDVTTITAIKLRPNHNMVLADGRARLDLCPVLFQGEGEIVNHRVDENWLEYHTLSGEPVSRYYSTTNTDLCGSTLEVYAKLKGKEIYSDTVSFTVIDPLPANLEEITIPVVFHIVQTSLDILSYGGEFGADRVALILERLNNAFAGVVVSPEGVDTKICFKPALYGPDKNLLLEEGINRLEVESINTTDNYADFIKQNNLLWEPAKYMNIWLMSDRENTMSNFGYMISNFCKPRHFDPEATDVPEGSGLTVLPEEKEWEPNEVGLLYKLQLFNLSGFEQGVQLDNEFNYYVGSYLGLLPTWGYKIFTNITEAEDYCVDTRKYVIDPDTEGADNITWDKYNGIYWFEGENIMDDQISLHRSVSRDQCLRMRWILQNCPERAAWKSDFAFTGK